MKNRRWGCFYLLQRVFAGDEEVSYIYSATGEKLAKKAGGSFTYYRGVMVYPSNTTLLYMQHPEGTVSMTSDGYTYNYFKTDHTGSTRVLLSAVNGSLQQQQTTDYYPFGLAWEYNNLNKNKYLFSGKELQDDDIGTSGLLGLYDFGARYYNPVLGRWFNVDPASQVANPYLFCGNSPAVYVDKDGRVFAIIPAIAMGAAIGAVSYTLDVAFSDGGFRNWNFGKFIKSMALSAVSGIVTAGVGEIFGPTGGFWNEAGRGLAHGIAQGGLSAIDGGNFLSGFTAGALSSWGVSGFQEWKGVGNTIAGMYIFGGISGGIGSAVSGGNFWEGMARGLTITALNHAHAAWETVAALKGELPVYSGKAMENGDMGGCTYAVLKSNAEYSGKELPANFQIEADGADYNQLANKNGLQTDDITVDEIEATLKQDRPIAVSYTVQGRGHTVGIQEFQQKTLPSGKTRQRFKVMDPDVGSIVFKSDIIVKHYNPFVLRILK